MSESLANRSIRIEESAVGSAIVSGDGNTIYVIQQTLEQRREESASDSPAEIGPNPYKGLAAFQERDAACYFGREAQIERLWQRFQDLYEQSKVPRFLPILGPSGCGKSSLARAGLISELARRPLLDKESLRVAVLVPGSRPLEALAGVLAKAATEDPLPVEKAEEFERVLQKTNDAGEHEGLRRIAGLIPGIHETPLVVLVDQFEEVYSLCKDLEQRQAFIGTLLQAASDPTGNVSVVVTLRSDFWEETQRHERLNQVIGSDWSLNVPAMTEEELRRAIAEPAKQAGHPLDDATIALLVKDTEGREGALPLLQFALTRIWEGLSEGKTPATTYREMGGVGGALAGKAQELYEKLSPSEQEIARRMFMGLVQLGEGTRDTRRRVKLKSLITVFDKLEILHQVIQQFSSSKARLISLSSFNGDEIAEVTHEALFEHWKLLHEWLEDSRDDIRQLRRLEDSANLWKENNKNISYLLKGHQLAVSRETYNKCSRDITLDIQEFVEASVEEENREYEKAKAREKRTIVSLATLSISIFVAAGLGFYSYIQTQKNLFQEQLTQVLYGGVTEPELLPVLSDSLNLAKRQRNTMRLDESLVSYQATLTAAQNFRNMALLRPESFGNENQRKIEEIWIEAEKDLVEIIISDRISSLSKNLNIGLIGYLNNASSSADFEKQFSEGALRETYKLLMRPWGVGADLNGSGVIENREEAERLPCDLMKTIDALWKEATDQRCSWYGNTFHQDFDCQELQEQTLVVVIFPPPTDFVVERIDYCLSNKSSSNDRLSGPFHSHRSFHMLGFQAVPSL